MTRQKIALLFMLIAFQLIATAQVITVEGKVTNKETNQPLPYAAVSLKSVSIGTITNQNGAFKFHIPEEHENDTLTVSMLGYQSFKKTVKELRKKNKIQLKPITFDLDEVNIDALSPRTIVGNAFKNMDNYIPDAPYMFDAYFTEHITEEGVRVRELEAAKTVYNGKKNVYIKINEIKLGKGLSKKDVGYIYSGEAMLMLSWHYFKGLYKDARKKGVFKIDTIHKTDNDLVYIISVELSKRDSECKFFVSSSKNALLRFEYRKKGVTGGTFDLKQVNKNHHEIYDYQWINNKLYPRYLYSQFTSSNYKSLKRNDTVCERINHAEYFINKIDSVADRSLEQKFADEHAKLYDILHQGYTFNPEFWKTYNYPDTDLKEFEVSP